MGRDHGRAPRPAASLPEELGLEAFIDDREDVREAMVGIVPRRILFRAWSEVPARLA